MPDPDRLPPYYPSEPPHDPEPSNAEVAADLLAQVDRVFVTLCDAIELQDLTGEQSDAYEAACTVVARAGACIDQLCHTLTDTPRPRGTRWP